MGSMCWRGSNLIDMLVVLRDFPKIVNNSALFGLVSCNDPWIRKSW